jgi:hypothetical protein
MSFAWLINIAHSTAKPVHGPQALSIVVCHLPKSAKHMLVVEFSDLEIGSAAERRSSMAKYLPKRLRTLYRTVPLSFLAKHHKIRYFI